MKKLLMMLVVTLMLGASLAVAQGYNARLTRQDDHRQNHQPRKPRRRRRPPRKPRAREDFYGQESGHSSK